jgi:AraC-like DNA-binding protein
MELVCEYIHLSTTINKSVYETAVIVMNRTDHVLLSYTLLDNDCLFDFSTKANQIEIKIAKTYFEKYDQPLELFIEKQTLCCNTQSKIFDLVNCNLQGLPRKIYIESIVLYLLFQIQKNNLVFQINCDSCAFLNKPIELEKIYSAKDFIIQNLDQNITIPTIASNVGTNQCYLKKGFKEVTGQTIFEFIQENRMIKAKHLLGNSDFSNSVIANMVGYSSLSSFSQTYKNYFGISPSREVKNSIPNF